MAEEKKNIPKLRFREFTGDNANAWELRKLGRISDISTGKAFKSSEFDKSGEFLVVTNKEISDSKFSNKVAGDRINISDDKILNKYVLIGQNILVTMDGVNIGKVGKYTNSKAVLAQRVGRVQSKQFDFVYAVLDNQKFVNKMNVLAVGNAIKHISLSQISDYHFWLPICDVEQQKIGSFFKHLDELITLHQRMLDEYKTLKKTMLSKIFPKNGEKYPELRFFGFTDAWELRKLGDIGSVAMNKRVFKHQTSDNGEIPFFKIGTFGGKADTFISRKLFEEYKRKYPYPNKGDILLSASGSIGKIVVYTGEDEYFQDSNIVWFKHDGKINNQFLKQFYTIVKWDGLEGSTIKRLYNKNILNTNILLPAIREQEKIGTFFKHLDSLITLHQRELELLKTLKKTMLQQMFV